MGLTGPGQVFTVPAGIVTAGFMPGDIEGSTLKPFKGDRHGLLIKGKPALDIESDDPFSLRERRVAGAPQKGSPDPTVHEASD